MDDLEKKIEVLFELDKYEEVLNFAHKNLNNSQENKLFLYSYIISSYINLSNYTDALKFCNDAISEYPYSTYLFYLKSKIYFNISKDKLSLEAIKEALKLSPNDSNYLMHEADVYYSLSDYVNAKESINKSLEIDSTNLNAHLINAKILYMIDGQKIAKEIVNEVLEKDPHHQQALYMKQHFYRNIKDKKSILKNLLSFNPQDKIYQSELKFIKNYYKFIPISMFIVLILDYLLQSNRSEFGFLEPYVMVCFFIVGVIGSNDWRFSLVFVSGVLLLDGWFHYGSRGLEVGDIMAIVFLAPLYHFVLYAMFLLFKSQYLRIREWMKN